MFLQNAGFDQRLEKPVDCLLGLARPCVQLGRRWRYAALRQNFENADGTQIRRHMFTHQDPTPCSLHVVLGLL